jgi:hypothetical protein
MKYYTVEVKFAKDRWTLLTTKNRQTDAMHYVKEHFPDISKYPIRILRVTRTVVMELKK